MFERLDELRGALGDRYEIEREVGQGAMASVFVARDVKHDRQVAIKVLKPELRLFSYHPERFLREVRTVAGLTHPHILPLHDSDECGGFLFYVMPYVTETLRQRMNREGELPIEEAVQIARDVAAALDYAHRQDVLHRDVKPENILLHEGRPLVADFGVARAISECCDNLTEIGVTVGTPAYMSPEQASADQELDGRSDLYALACVLYEMLVGAPPFTGNPRQTMAKHATEIPTPIRQLRGDIPIPLEEAITKALAKEPADRFASSGEFGAALGIALARATASRPTATRDGIEQRPIAVLPFVNASPDLDAEYFSDGMTDELISALTKVEGLQVVSRTSVFALKGHQMDIRSIGAKLGVSAVLEGTVRRSGSRLRITVNLTDVSDGKQLWSERYDREEQDVFLVQEEIARNIVNTLRRTILAEIGDPTSRRYTDNVQAYNLYLKGRYHWNRRSDESIAEAMEHFKRAIALDSEYALAYSGLADSYALHLDYRGVHVAEGMECAKDNARKALQLDPTLAEAHTSLGWVTFIYDWDWQAAEREFLRALDINPGYAVAHQWYAWLLMALGRQDEAVAEGRAALDLDPASVSVRRGLGWLHHYAQEPQAAIRHLRRAVNMDPTASETHRILGLALLQQGSYEEAESALQEAVALSVQSAYATAALGYLHARRGSRDQAIELCEALNARSAREYVSPVALATVYLGLGEHDKVFEQLERAYAERRGWLAYLKVDPLLDPVRSDRRFGQLLQRMQLA